MKALVVVGSCLYLDLRGASVQFPLGIVPIVMVLVGQMPRQHQDDCGNEQAGQERGLGTLIQFHGFGG